MPPDCGSSIFRSLRLPLFGLGQASIPTEKTASRQYTFALACVYVAAALGLLLTTSFLGLRKYLRQRRLEMPATMAGTWLFTGVALIAVVICFTALLPRTNAEYAFSELPSQLTSEKHDSSKISAGKEGVRDEKTSSARGDPNQPQDENSQQKTESSGRSKSTEKSDRNQSQNGDSKSNDSKSSSNSKSQSGKSADSKSGESKSSQSKSNNSSDSKSNASKSDQSKSSDSKSGNSKSADSKSDQSATKAPKPAESKPKSASGSTKPQSPPPNPQSSPPAGTPPAPNFPLLAQWIGDLLKYAFYGLLAGLFIWWLIFHWRALVDWLASLVNGWQNLWGFRRAKEVSLEEFRARPNHKHFADFSDPFASGIAGRYPPIELVRYTFEALEAWARDNGLPRQPNQTAHEFAHQIAMNVEPLAGPSRTLADLYSRAAYAPKTLPASTFDDLREFWQRLLRVDASHLAAPGVAG